MIGGRVLDLTALLDITTGATVYGRALLTVAVEQAVPLVVPAAALHEAWAASAVGDYPFLDALLETSVVVVDDLKASTAMRAGTLAHDVHAASAWDAAAAHAVYVAQERGWPVVTADPVPLRAIDAGIDVELLP